jgi:DNA-binding Lrp family transcriptional regulator
MTLKLDAADVKILQILQSEAKLSMREIAERLSLHVTTVHSKVKRMEQQGLVKCYRAILEPSMVGIGATAFILAAFSYGAAERDNTLSQKEVAKRIAAFPEVQEVHIISGDWDLLIKVKTKDVNTTGEFVVNKLRTVKGIEKTTTCMVFHTAKETTTIDLSHIQK